MVTASAAVAVGFAACGGGGGTEGSTTSPKGKTPAKITRAQWESVRLGTPTQRVIGRLGAPAGSATSGKFPTYGYSTTDPDIDASFTFEAKTDQLHSKVWSERTQEKNPISLADFRGITTGMTQAQVEKRLGLPTDRTDEISRFALPDNRETPGLLSHCLHYVWTPNPDYAAAFCFDRAGRLFYKYAFGA
jgi:hypothetical protein